MTPTPESPEQAKPEHKVDRTGWPAGPWDDEPDRVEWTTAEGLPAIALRQESGGHWCGYVAVPKGHPCYGLNYCTTYETGAGGETDFDRVKPNPVNDLDVHGSITYGQACADLVCHVPKMGEPDDVWWLGFDCAYHRDLRPGIAAREAKLGLPPLWDEPDHDIYRTLVYVKSECESLAHQLREMAVTP